jgi:ABC-type lipoprotein export system ATPase subunit
MIELQGIGRTYRRPGGEPVEALRDVSLRIERGDFVAIVGSSGSGKSTLMNVLGLLDRPDAGRYLLDGEDVSVLDADRQARTRNRRIGFVFQAFHLLPRTSALENVELPLLYSDRTDIGGLGRRALESVGLGDRIDHNPRASGGSSVATPGARQRARPAAHKRAHREHLDAGLRRKCSASSAAEPRSRTVVLVTHDPAVAGHCGRVALEGGHRRDRGAGGEVEIA